MVQQGNPMLRILSTALDFYMFIYVYACLLFLCNFVSICWLVLSHVESVLLIKSTEYAAVGS